MSGEKRPAPDAFGSSNQLVVKRQKSDSNLNSNAVTVRSAQNGALVQAVSRMPFSASDILLLYPPCPSSQHFTDGDYLCRFPVPVDLRPRSWSSQVSFGRPMFTMQKLIHGCKGHSGEIFATRFDPTAQNIASGSMDRNISMFPCTPDLLRRWKVF